MSRIRNIFGIAILLLIAIPAVIFSIAARAFERMFDAVMQTPWSRWALPPAQSLADVKDDADGAARTRSFLARRQERVILRPLYWMAPAI